MSTSTIGLARTQEILNCTMVTVKKWCRLLVNNLDKDSIVTPGALELVIMVCV